MLDSVLPVFSVVAMRLLVFVTMKCLKDFSLVFGVAFMTLAATGARAEEIIPILKTDGQTYTNVVALNTSATHLFFRYAGGVESVRLSTLEPELQRKFGYDPVNEAQEEKESKSDAHALVINHSTNAPMVAQGTVTKTFSLRDSGDLQITFPKGWKVSLVESPPQLAPSMTIWLRHPLDDNFAFCISTVARGNPLERVPPQQALVISGNQILARSTEKNLTLEPLNGDQFQGHYFTLTDKASVANGSPPKGRHLHQTEGIVRMDGLTICFAVGSNLNDEKELEAALETVRTAQWVAKP
jgi:hypothetical protein